MKINVNLYGGYTGNERNRAEIIHCDHCNECDLYKEGKCINVTEPFSKRCKIGRIEQVQGYTKRAAARYDFDKKYEADECYNKLKYPSSSSWAYREVGDTVLLNLTYAVVEKRDYDYICYKWKNTEDFRVHECGFSVGKISYVSKDELTIELLYRICGYTPRSMMGTVINDYSSEKIPLLLRDMKKFNPSLYEKFTAKYPEFDDMPINCIGKHAYLYTLNKNAEYISDNSTFRFNEDGTKLICENYKSIFMPFGTKTARVEIEVTKDMTCKITDNGQVTEDTIFC